MIIPTGTKVAIKETRFAPLSFLAGQEATVIGYEDDPPTVISLLKLELPGDVTFKWPKCFPWEVEVIDEDDN